MAIKKDYTNQKIGKLLVLRQTKRRNTAGCIIWECKCQCGNICYKDSQTLRRSNKNLNCGCLGKNGLLKDLTGQKFGRLTVIKRAQNTKDGRSQWLCKCDCGNETIVIGKNLSSGKTISCGCYHLEQIKKVKRDISGQRFGLLTAIEPTEKRKENTVVWICKCDCGNYCQANEHSLITKKKQSCGCIKKSLGQAKIEKILKQLNIIFEKEKTFINCIYPDTQQHPRFDFFLIDKNILIQYDGIQHFKNSKFKNFLNLEYQQEKDKFKDQWCKINNIPLLRIPYTDYDIIDATYLINKIKDIEKYRQTIFQKEK